MDPLILKLKLLCFALSQIFSHVGVDADTSASLAEKSYLRVNFLSHLNATNYRILTARMETSSRAKREQVSVDLIQTEQFLNDIKVLTFDIVTAVPAFTFADGYESFRGFGRYKLYTSSVTWPEAKKKCEDDGAHLMVIETTAEAEVVKALFARKPTFPGSSDSKYVSIGVNDIEKENHFVTVTGKDLNSLEYKTLNLYHTDPRGENYVCASADGAMHDFPNGWKLGFICEAS